MFFHMYHHQLLLLSKILLTLHFYQVFQLQYRVQFQTYQRTQTYLLPLLSIVPYSRAQIPTHLQAHLITISQHLQLMLTLILLLHIYQFFVPSITVNIVWSHELAPILSNQNYFTARSCRPLIVNLLLLLKP